MSREEEDEWSDIESSGSSSNSSDDGSSSEESSSSSSTSIKHRKRDKKHKRGIDNGSRDTATTNKEKSSKRDADIDLEHLYAVSIGDVRKRTRFDHTGGGYVNNNNNNSDEEDEEEQDSSYSHSLDYSSEPEDGASVHSSLSSSSSSSSGDSSDDTVDREAQRILQQPDPVISSYESSSSSSTTSTESSLDDSKDDASDCSIDVTDYDVCKARYQLLHDKEQRYTALRPETRERYRRQLELSVWAPLNEASFNLEGRDRKQVFKDYARVALLELLPQPIEPSKEATKRMVKILRF